MVNRYELDLDYVPYEDEPVYEMRECKDGEYVKYDDYALAMDKQRRELLASHLVTQAVAEEKANKEIARLTSIISGAQLELEDERKKRIAAESRVAELERDAARYRWLRTYAEVEIPQTWLAYNSLYRDDTADTWDSVIDVAMRGRASRNTEE